MDNKKITSENYDELKENNHQKVNQDKKTKDKSKAQKAVPILVVAVVSLVVILTCVLIAYYQIYNSGKQNANILEGVYASSYYSMVDNMNNLHVDVAKYSNLSTNQAKIATMTDIKGDCNYILAGLSVLPIDEENVISATRFFNQISGLCDAYTAQINKGENLTQEQELIFDKISLVLGEIKSNFNLQTESMVDGGFNFIDASIFNDEGVNELSLGMGNLTNSAIEYPSMIFDGPFSSALETKEIRGLSEKEITQEEAEKYLKEIVYNNREDVEIFFDKTTNGDIDTFDFNVEVDGKKFYAQISKRGGLLITLSGYAEGGDAILNKENAIDVAEKFANRIGFENMQAVWTEINENVAYINLAPIESNVIMYPDLVKVKLDLTAKEIIGFEALNYVYNHVDRSFEFNLSESDVESVLGFDYNIIKTSKAIIRLDGGKEVAVYEFVTEKIDGVYFYYVDANQKEIVKTLKLVTVKDVEKLI